MWKFAKGITQQERDRSFHKMDIYRKYFNKTILNRKHSNTLITIPLKKIEPSRQLLCKRVEWLREMHTVRAAK
ncbi:hypothetical protein QBC45DRAFT_417151 [Copromyces sp. CBS 386.78]|nr:hypothetical protein QBC45DRAFT_417151 [Copromyces sp. CBS 386.78]